MSSLLEVENLYFSESYVCVVGSVGVETGTTAASAVHLGPFWCSTLLLQHDDIFGLLWPNDDKCLISWAVFCCRGAGRKFLKSSLPPSPIYFQVVKNLTGILVRSPYVVGRATELCPALPETFLSLQGDLTKLQVILRHPVSILE